MMSAVVTGGSGFIGSHIVDELLRRGFRVRCLVRSGTSSRWLTDPRLDLREVDYGDQASVTSACAGAEYVIHCAGTIAGRNLEEYMDGNRTTTEVMLRAALTHSATLQRFVHMSSLTAVGPAPAIDKPIDSSSPTRPITDYGRSKLAAEESVRNASQRIPFTIIRPPAVYGERDLSTLSLFQAMRYHLALLMGFTAKWVSLVHVSDLARGTVDAMLSNATIGKTYALTGDRPYTWSEIFREIGTAMETWFVPIRLPHAVVLALGAVSGLIGRFRSKPPVFNLDKGRDFIQDAWVCSNDEAWRDFGYIPHVGLHEGIRRTTAWYRSQGWV
ncbi:MAG: NAD-dependent epimerase/dehydratase family protein [Candidatus Kapaibacterium sp.]